jgi:hypothetical protein
MTGQPSQPSSGHSKLPWHVKNEEAIKVADSKGDSILSMYHTHLKGRRPINEVEANAALIVEAVNSHAALKARVAELEKQLNTWKLTARSLDEEVDAQAERITELEGALRALRLQALQSSVNDPANEWGLEALHQANAALSHAGPVARDGEK